MTNSRTAKMLEKVRALLAKADSTPFSGEADVFRAKADEIMTNYAIEQWMVDKAQADMIGRPEPEIRRVDFGWYRDSQHYQKLWSLYQAVARHCRCVIATRGWSYSQDMPMIGLASDLDYFDMLFTHLMLQMGKQLEPDVESNLEPGHNVFRLRQAGLPWPRIAEKMFKMGQVEPSRRETEKVVVWWERHRPGEDMPAEIDWKLLERSGIWVDLKNRLANWNRAYVKENGLQGERNYIRPVIYQDGFAEGFVSEIRLRFYQMREAQTNNYDASHEAGSMALVVRDIYDQSLALYDRTWPPPPPVEVSTKPSGRVSKAVTRERAFSWDAYNAGKKAGAEADLMNKPGGRIGGRKEIR